MVATAILPARIPPKLPAWSPAMLNVHRADRSRYCDGLSRRSMLKLGACTLGGLSLAQLFQAEAAAGIGSSSKAIINIHLGGGPSHQDMFDLKPEAPREFRGEFS